MLILCAFVACRRHGSRSGVLCTLHYTGSRLPLSESGSCPLFPRTIRDRRPIKTAPGCLLLLLPYTHLLLLFLPKQQEMDAPLLLVLLFKSALEIYVRLLPLLGVCLCAEGLL